MQARWQGGSPSPGGPLRLSRMDFAFSPDRTMLAHDDESAGTLAFAPDFVPLILLVGTTPRL